MLGQTLIVMSGVGWVLTEGGAKEEICSGDVIWIPAGEKHWHVDGKRQRRTVSALARP
jgi:quercetin dioxygenase-like cupin family protein